MSTYTPYDYKAVSQLNSTTATSSDLFLVSQLSGNEYISRKLPYSDLCALLLKDIDELVSSEIFDYVSELSSKICTNIDNISSLSIDTKYLISAVIKMANCIQTNKSNISILTSIIDGAKCENGLSIQQSPMENGIVIGHVNKIDQSNEASLYKIQYDENGHITEATKIEQSDFDEFGIFLTNTTEGLEITDDGTTMSLLPAKTDTIGGVIVGDNLTVDDEGKIDAVNTTYVFQEGLSSTDNEDNVYLVNLVKAEKEEIGGIKLGDDFYLDDEGHLKADVLTPQATDERLGTIKVNCNFNDETKIPVQVDEDGGAYVNIDNINNDDNVSNAELETIKDQIEEISSVLNDNSQSIVDYTSNDKTLNINLGPYSASTTMDIDNSSPIGTIINVAGDDEIEGYLKCDGSSYYINSYPDLFARIAGRTPDPDEEEFCVPDLRDKKILPYINYYIKSESIESNETIENNLLYRFAVISDPHIKETSYYNNETHYCVDEDGNSVSINSYGNGVNDLAKAFETFKNKNCDFCCVTGDITDTSSEEEYKLFNQIKTNHASNMQVYCCAGNHDAMNDNTLDETHHYWNTYVGHPWNHIFEKDNDVFIMLGLSYRNKSSVNGSISSQTSPYERDTNELYLTWLEEQLNKDEYNDKRIFLFMHYPLWFDVNNRTNYPGIGEYGIDSNTHGFALNSTEPQRFKQIFENHKNIIVFNGHSHFEFQVQEDYPNINFFEMKTEDNEKVGALAHVPSINFTRHTNRDIEWYNGSQGYIVDVYEDSVVLNAFDFHENKYLLQYRYRI